MVAAWRAVLGGRRARNARRLSLIATALLAGAFLARLADQAIVRFPRQARFWSDRGVLRAMMGLGQPALGGLLRAIRLDSGFLRVYVTLGSLYLAEGRANDARALYDLALNRPATPEFKDLWLAIQKDRAAL